MQNCDWVITTGPKMGCVNNGKNQRVFVLRGHEEKGRCHQSLFDCSDFLHYHPLFQVKSNDRPMFRGREYWPAEAKEVLCEFRSMIHELSSSVNTKAGVTDLTSVLDADKCNYCISCLWWGPQPDVCFCHKRRSQTLSLKFVTKSLDKAYVGVELNCKLLQKRHEERKLDLWYCICHVSLVKDVRMCFLFPSKMKPMHTRVAVSTILSIGFCSKTGLALHLFHCATSLYTDASKETFFGDVTFVCHPIDLPFWARHDRLQFNNIDEVHGTESDATGKRPNVLDVQVLRQISHAL